MKTTFLSAAIVFLTALPAFSAGKTEVCSVKSKGKTWEYILHVPGGYDPKGWKFHRITCLVHGVGGEGRQFGENEDWRKWADDNNVFLLCPTFTNKKEGVNDEWYWNADQGSGDVFIDMATDAGKKYRVYPGQFLTFGFSGGAQFSHKFAPYKPELVAAYAFANAGMVDQPDKKLVGLPVLVICGEADAGQADRIGKARQYYDNATKLGMRPVWRSYPGVEHALTAEGTRLAQEFLKYHLVRTEPITELMYAKLIKDAQAKVGYKPETPKPGARPKPPVPFLQVNPAFAGNSADWTYYDLKDKRAQLIPPTKIVYLPSKEVADAWGKPAAAK